VFAGLVFGLVVAGTTVAGVVVRRRRARRTACPPGATLGTVGPVPVELGHVPMCMSATRAAPVTVEDNKRLVARARRRGHQRWEPRRGRPAVRPGDRAGREGLGDAVSGGVPRRADGHVALIGEGDIVVGHFRCSGTHTGPWMGRPPNSRVFRNVREVYWFTVRGGRIVDWWGLEDDDDRRRQLGSPTSPS
jgi:hypothetical protein